MTKNFIKVYDNVIPHSYCDDMIKKFELSKKDWVYKSVPQGEAKLGYKELPLSKNQDFSKNEIDYLTNVFVERIKDYQSQFSKFCWPDRYQLEFFKIKKYDANDIDEFGFHVDVSAKENLSRLLAFFLYLSDNEEGKTEFPYQDTVTDCRKGSIVFFPPMWPWLHRGTKPIKEPKYFLGSYLRYVE